MVACRNSDVIVELSSFLITETSVRPIISIKKFLAFVFLSVCVPRDSGLRNYLIYMKFDTNVYALFVISCTVFDAHFPNNSYIEILKSIPMFYGLWKEIL